MNWPLIIGLILFVAGLAQIRSYHLERRRLARLRRREERRESRDWEDWWAA